MYPPEYTSSIPSSNRSEFVTYISLRLYKYNPGHRWSINVRLRTKCCILDPQKQQLRRQWSRFSYHLSIIGKLNYYPSSAVATWLGLHHQGHTLPWRRAILGALRQRRCAATRTWAPVIGDGILTQLWQHRHFRVVWLKQDPASLPRGAAMPEGQYTAVQAQQRKLERKIHVHHVALSSLGVGIAAALAVQHTTWACTVTVTGTGTGTVGTATTLQRWTPDMAAGQDQGQ